MSYISKRILTVDVLILLTFALIGCACNGNTASAGPDNPNFTVVVDEARTQKVLAYFQAHTGYLPAVVLLDDATLQTYAENRMAQGLPAERADLLAAAAEGATCLLLADESLIAEYEALGYVMDNEALKNLSASYRIDNADVLGLSVVQMPTGSALNSDALKALAAWLTGAEAKYLADNPDLLQ